MSDGWTLLKDIALVFAGAVLLGAIFERLRQAAVVGYMLAGAILGPGLLRVVESVDAVHDLAELGVALLLFTIGLEFSWRHIRRLGRVGVGGGVVQVTLTTLLCVALAPALGLEWRSAFAVGAVVALSSTVVVLKQLRDRGDLDAIHGRTALGILLVQDVALIPLVLLMTMLGGEHQAGLQWQELGVIAAQISLVVLVSLIAIKYFTPRAMISRAMGRNRELPVLVSVTVCIGSAWAAHRIGVSPALGAFLAGMLLAETSHAVTIRADIASVRTLFSTLFFTSIGMLADFGWIAGNFGWVALTAAGIVVVKALIVLVSVRLFGMTMLWALSTGIVLGQVGELSFVLIQVGRSQGLLADEIAQLLVSSSVLTLLATPYLVAIAPSFSRKVAKRLMAPRKFVSEEIRATRRLEEIKDHFVVIGFGEAGRAAARKIEAAGASVLVLDVNPRLARDGRGTGLRFVVGDGTNDTVLEHAGLKGACGVVVALSDHQSAVIAAHAVRRVAPSVPCVVRARYNLYASDLENTGVDGIVDEENLVGESLANEVLRITQNEDAD